MGADNWTTCPKCRINYEAEREKQRAKIAKAYGVLESDKYREMCRAFDAKETPPEPTETLREDYEQGLDNDGEYSCSYSCSCRECGFSFNFNTKIEAETVLAKKK